MNKSRENEETARVGSKWTDEEDEKLTEEINDKKNYEEIALEHKRTIIGIKSRVISHIIYPKYKDDINIDNISNEYNIEKEILNKYINNIKNKNVEMKIKPEIKKLIDLEDRIKIIENKLDYLIDCINKINLY